MARRRKHVPLNVFLNSRFVGRLNREASGAIDFQYDSSWLEWEYAFPVSLSLPLREDRYVGAPVVAVFDNLLPDSDSIRRRVAERVGADGVDAYSLLTAVGRDCVGALQFLPDGQDPDPAGTIDGTPVDDDEIARLLNNLASAPLGLDPDQDFRISIAGAQEKTALLFWEGRWCKPHGTTATTHILKPQIGRIPNGIDLSDSIENEFICLRLTAELGIPSAKVAIGDFGGKRALVVQRFDRHWTRDSRLLRLPQEDCCQALSIPPTLKYQAEGGPGIRDILDLLKGSDEPEADQSTFLRAAIVFWLLGATDGHAKNFSIFLNPGGRFRLTPFYDVLSAQPSLDAGQIQRKQMKLAMSVGDKRHYRIDDIMPRHFLQTAEKAGVGAPVVQPILDDLQSAVPGAVERVVRSLPSGFPEHLVSSIVGGIESRLSRIEA
ncbi:type II toxin-antitoxin system HipA family toxin [Microvirga sp. VF16]|uniref:type II toxin-antitoxin system HipA family toxin n=1 Tax=Microvirga sp. VF16 TaxID=2807101 RepID=UPI00193D95DB|nr:type II toxin-antitoxin system HipA family toxin [Microvirga sp. VF16]QRM35536.1 type II toxin-antitoxin system HipA family toxin [Microvirga sp. VF16]